MLNLVLMQLPVRAESSPIVAATLVVFVAASANCVAEVPAVVGTFVPPADVEALTGTPLGPLALVFVVFGGDLGIIFPAYNN